MEPLLTIGGSNFDGPTILALLRRDGPEGFSDTELFMRALRDDAWELPVHLYPKAVSDLKMFLRNCYVPVYIKKAVECSMHAGK